MLKSLKPKDKENKKFNPLKKIRTKKKRLSKVLSKVMQSKV